MLIKLQLERKTYNIVEIRYFIYFLKKKQYLSRKFYINIKIQ